MMQQSLAKIPSTASIAALTICYARKFASGAYLGQVDCRRVPEVRETTGTMLAAGATDPGVARTKSGPLPPIPEHLRNRLRYVALTAEMTGGGIDARREDGLARLVLWRDVVGVVARRMPPAYDGAAFVDIVSTAGSTLRIVPWTRLTGELVDVDGDARPRAVV